MNFPMIKNLIKIFKAGNGSQNWGEFERRYYYGTLNSKMIWTNALMKRKQQEKTLRSLLEKEEQ